MDDVRLALDAELARAALCGPSSGPEGFCGLCELTWEDMESEVADEAASVSTASEAEDLLLRLRLVGEAGGTVTSSR